MLPPPNLKAHFGYPKFASPPYRILFPHIPDNELNVQRMLLAELRRRGHEVVEQPFQRGLAPEEALSAMLRAAAEVRPDGVLTLNDLGLDNQGRTTTVLSELGLPVITWYLDNHLFTGATFEDSPPEWAIAFTYERQLEVSLRAAGFRHVFYLPLASDPALAAAHDQGRFHALNDKVSYVGDTFARAAREFHEDRFEAQYADWRPDFGAQKEALGRIDLAGLFAPFRERFTTRESFHRFMAYVVAKETLHYRAAQLSSLAEDDLVVFGPADWKEHLPEEIVRPAAGYWNETPLIYRHSAVNLSLTTLQHETALNQRYYDIPLCGGFLLGEWQTSLPEQFEPGVEAVSFRDRDELVDKARYYRNHPDERQAIALRGRERVLKDHLIEHRVAALLTEVERVCRG